MHEVYWDLLWSLNLSYLFFSMSPIYFIVDLFSWTSQVNFFPNPLRWYFNPRSKAWVHRQSATGTLAPSLILANDTIDLILPTFWIYPPKVDVLQNKDIDCIGSKMKSAKKKMKVSKDSSDFARVIVEIEEDCLKSFNHFVRPDAIYETPSDYDPLSINMGQLIIYRFTLRCRCDESKLSYGAKCASILPYSRQGWPAYMGTMGTVSLGGLKDDNLHISRVLANLHNIHSSQQACEEEIIHAIVFKLTCCYKKWYMFKWRKKSYKHILHQNILEEEGFIFQCDWICCLPPTKPKYFCLGNVL